MSKACSPLEPERRLDLTTVCMVVGVFFALAAVLAGWNAWHGQTIIPGERSFNNYIICVGAALISIFFFYNAFAATEPPPAMTPLQEARTRKLYSSVAYGPVMRDLNQDLDEKSKWPEAD